MKVMEWAGPGNLNFSCRGDVEPGDAVYHVDASLFSSRYAHATPRRESAVLAAARDKSLASCALESTARDRNKNSRGSAIMRPTRTAYLYGGP